MAFNKKQKELFGKLFFTGFALIAAYHSEDFWNRPAKQIALVLVFIFVFFGDLLWKLLRKR